MIFVYPRFLPHLAPLLHALCQRVLVDRLAIVKLTALSHPPVQSAGLYNRKTVVTCKITYLQKCFKMF